MCEHWCNEVVITKNETPYTGKILEVIENVWRNYIEYYTIKSGKCLQCRKILMIINTIKHFQIQWLAQAMKDVTPSKYLDLIIKSK